MPSPASCTCSVPTCRQHRELPSVTQWATYAALAAPLAVAAVLAATWAVRSRTTSAPARRRPRRSPCGPRLGVPRRPRLRRSQPPGARAPPAAARGRRRDGRASLGRARRRRDRLRRGVRGARPDRTAARATLEGGRRRRRSAQRARAVDPHDGPPRLLRVVPHRDGPASRVHSHRRIHLRRRRSMSTPDGLALTAIGPRVTRTKEHQAMGHLRSPRARRTLRVLGSLLAAGVLMGTQLGYSTALAAPVPTVVSAAAAPRRRARRRTSSACGWRAPASGSRPASNKGDAIPKYHWLVVQDDTGDPTHYGTNLGATDTKNSNYACTPAVARRRPGLPGELPVARDPLGQGRHQRGGRRPGRRDDAQRDDRHRHVELAGQRPQPEPQLHDLGHGRGLSTFPAAPSPPTVTCHVDGFKIDGAWFSLPLPDNGPTTAT